MDFGKIFFADMFPREDETEEGYVARLRKAGFTVDMQGDYMRITGTPLPPEPEPGKDIDATRKKLARSLADEIMKDADQGRSTIPNLTHSEPERYVRDYGMVRTLSSTASDAKLTVGTAPPRSFILEDAKDIVYGARQHMYGHASVNFARTAALWEGIFGQKVTNLQVGAAMLQLKLARLGNLIQRETLGGPSATFAEIEDTMKDIAGYAEATMRSLFEAEDGTRFDQQSTSFPAGRNMK